MCSSDLGGSSNRLLRPVMALPFHLHMLLGQTALYEKAYATAFVLICILIIMHILSEVIMLGTGGIFIEYIRNKKRKLFSNLLLGECGGDMPGMGEFVAANA